MKPTIVKLKIQFDLAIGNGTIEDVRRTLNEINEVLQQSFPFEQPQLFVGAVSDEDIEIANDENEDEEDGGTMDGHIHPQKPIWSNIDTMFEDEEEGLIYVDAWVGNDEDGQVIAKVSSRTGEVIYLDERARTDNYAQNMITELVYEIKKGFV